MLKTYLPIPNVYWTTDTFAVTSADPGQAPDAPATGGRFATAHRAGDTVVLTRDMLGLNKLYFAVDADRGVLAANYLADLVQAGTTFDAIYAVPAGTSAVIDLHQRSIRLRRHRRPAGAGNTSPQRHLEDARDRLIRHLEVAAAAQPAARVAVCLSGGLDSGLIAALLCTHFANVRAYTYAFDDGSGPLSPDAVAAEQLARRLGLPGKRHPLPGPASGAKSEIEAS
jgi:asparagine synthetase B (glutamine-hydrolysing)